MTDQNKLSSEKFRSLMVRSCELRSANPTLASAHSFGQNIHIEQPQVNGPALLWSLSFCLCHNDA